MKYIKFYLLWWPIILLLNSCGPDKGDCDVTPAIVDNLVSLTPIQSQFQVGDILTISCNIPAQNTFVGNSVNIFQATGDGSALWSLGNGSALIRNQQLIIRKGSVEVNNLVAIYSSACDCYEFDADLILTDPGVYNFRFNNQFYFIDSGCDGYAIETTFPWINFPNVLEFEVVP